MLNQINNRIRFSKKVKKDIRKIHRTNIPLESKLWDSNKNDMKLLKNQVRIQLKKLQDNCCAYCGLRMDRTSASQIEHIAPKSDKKELYPQFMFTPYNLVLACSYCNGFSKKGVVNTIDRVNINYRNCLFNIYHPYFDNPNIHFEWDSNPESVIIRPKTDRGRRTIKLFKLDDCEHLDARAAQKMHDKYKNLPDHVKELIKNVMDYN